MQHDHQNRSILAPILSPWPRQISVTCPWQACLRANMSNTHSKSAFRPRNGGKYYSEEVHVETNTDLNDQKFNEKFHIESYGLEHLLRLLLGFRDHFYPRKNSSPNGREGRPNERGGGLRWMFSGTTPKFHCVPNRS